VNRKADFFYKTNRFKSIRIANWNALKFTNAATVAELSNPDVVGTARDVEDFQRLVTDHRHIISVTADHGALWRHHRTTAECYKPQTMIK